MNSFSITTGDSGQTTLDFLQQQIPAAPAGYLSQLLRKGSILLNGRSATGQDRVQTGDVLTLPASGRLSELLRQSHREQIEILLEGPDFLAVYKPAGLAVHRGAGHEKDNLAERVGNWLKRRRLPFGAAPVHRLDAGTSGPVLFAKGRRAASALGNQFMAGRVDKHYLALVAGETAASGTLETPVPAKGKLKAAASRYRKLAGNRNWSLLQLELLSGRKHQLRRQLADAGHPLAGDRRYGGPAPDGCRRLFLHCCYLAWPDPASACLHEVSCPLPQELRQLLTAAGLTLPDSM